MSFTPAKPVHSSQAGVHDCLQQVLNKHKQNDYRKPIAEHNQQAFAQVYQQWLLRGKPELILDSGCGTGASTHYLGRRYPDHWVIGLDQSAKRLGHGDNANLPANVFLVRCDCVDFWRLAAAQHWRFQQHFLLYPNPYPKVGHLKRRWHGHPVFPCLLALSDHLELRTNWAVYGQEFLFALRGLGYQDASLLPLQPTGAPMTAFERKYQLSGHQLWQLCVDLRRRKQ
ncbi:MAG: SAM-dependent methyltransferase [Cellvibrionaceae bacterium]|nr:SAM-dependent methyltransferase [Cellvibrionaceae bacterium]